jgi:hypothetical protein
MLEQIKHTKEAQPGIRIVIAGQEKTGKTTLACGAPNALLIPLEAGYSNQEINHVPMLNTYEEFISLIEEITTACANNTFTFTTVVIDSATALERLIHESVLKLDPLYKRGASKSISMDNALGGYGRAFQLANERFVEVVALLDKLAINHTINIVITCHVFTNTVIDPQAGEYMSWDLLLHSPKNMKTYGKREMISQWCDGIFFLHEPLMVLESNNIKKGVSENKGRILGLSRTPGYTAGNRFGLEGEIPIPKEQGWNYLAKAIYDSCGIDVFKR